MRQLVTESLVLSLIGGVAAGGVRLIAALDPAASLRLQNLSGLGVVSFARIRLDVPALLVIGALALLTGLVFGSAPAAAATRAPLEGGRLSRHGAAPRWRVGPVSGRGALAVLQVTLAVVLVAGSGLMLRSLAKLIAVDPGFDPSRTLTLRVNLLADSAAAAASTGYYDRLLTRLRALPGVTSAALTACPPLNGGCNRTRARLLDRPAPATPADEPVVGVGWVTPGWFSVARVPLVRGRDFRAGDVAGARRAVIINRTAARTLWPHQDPIGRPVRLGQGGFGTDTGWVVGMVGDVRYKSLESAPAAEFYLPFAQSPRPAAVIFLRTTGDPTALRASAERAVREVDPNIPAFDVRTMDARAGDATAQARFAAILLSLFAGLALLLATLGNYGVMSSTVASRMREIGIRVALGATHAQTLRIAVGEGALVVLLGTALGVGAAFWATRALQAMLFGVEASDLVTFAVTVAVLAVSAVAAAAGPAQRAWRADPVSVLRQE